MAQQIPATAFDETWKKLISTNQSFVICFRMTPCPPCEVLKPKYEQLAHHHRSNQCNVLFFWLDAPSTGETSALFNELFVHNKVGLVDEKNNKKSYQGAVPFVFCSFYDKRSNVRHIGTAKPTDLKPLDMAIRKFGY